MRIVIASDSWKDCLPAHEVSAAIAAGVRRASPSASIVEVPMADGGEGTVEALVRATGGAFHFTEVVGPRGEPVNARYGVLGDGTTAVIEMAAAAGLELVPAAERNPWTTTTYGVGQLLRAALDRGVRRIVLGIGGSATNDGGAGFAEALGYRLLDADDRSTPRGGGFLYRLSRIDSSQKDPRLEQTTIDVACDVTNPLTGPHGASAVYGPQKGADPDMVGRLDDNLKHWARILKRDLNIDVADVAGGGAAGGLGAGLLAFAGARLRRGVELVVDAVDLRSKLIGCDLCLTGEGSLDRSSAFGKTAVGVAEVCRSLGTPCVVLAGRVEPEARMVLECGATAYFGVAPRPCSLAEALAAAPEWLADSAEQIVRLAQIFALSDCAAGDRS